MEYGEKRAEDEPNHRAAGQYLDGQLEPRGAEQAPIESENRHLGKGQGEGVEYFDYEEQKARVFEDFFGCSVRDGRVWLSEASISGPD
jgi:hypothetical protein